MLVTNKTLPANAIEKVAIMQPYLFPYLGYWQLLSSVDLFIVYDDVNFIKKGFVNRNSILVNGSAHRITLELVKMSQNKKINQIALDRLGEYSDKVSTDGGQPTA